MREADERTLRAWIGHPHLKIIESCEDFKYKMERAFQAILNVVGDPHPVEIERKFLLKRKPNFSSRHFCDMAKIAIEQVYLKGGKRIRKMTKNGYMDYIYLSEKRDPATKIIKKDRYYFAWENQYFELDVFRAPKGLCLLEVELIDKNDNVKLPPFLEVVRDVTGERKYTNHAIARSL